uniref:uncharacterized protein LOC120334951 n=1 Tax=Styela clava TaxID=7725 RepID=UPI00193AA65D|nr:uncharacterized protein LOC120334951 [Styela clava]
MPKFLFLFITIVIGNPSINRVLKNNCKSSLLISWNPHKNAVGFPHRIYLTSAVLKRENKTIWIDSPTSGEQTLEVNEFSSIARSKVEITACVTKLECHPTHSAIKTIMTGEINQPIEPVLLAQYKDNQTCVISWTMSNNITSNTGPYSVKLHLISTVIGSLHSSKQMINVTTSSISSRYWFEPETNHEYSASVQDIYCNSPPVDAIGSCTGFLKNKTSFEFDTLSFVIGFIIPLLLLFIATMCIIRQKQQINKLKVSPIATDHNYETISNKAPKPNHRSHISDSYTHQETVVYEKPLPLTRMQINVESAYEPYNA